MLFVLSVLFVLFIRSPRNGKVIDCTGGRPPPRRGCLELMAPERDLLSRSLKKGSEIRKNDGNWVMSEK